MSTIHDAFRLVAATGPSAVALVHGARSMTYGQLDLASDALAAELAQQGCRRGHVVPVVASRSMGLVVALLGVLKTGAAYAAFDPRNADSVMGPQLAQLPSPVAVAGEHGDEPHWSRLSGGGTLALEVTPLGAAGDPCSVFFTSGTTSDPKGVLVPHVATVELFRQADFARLGSGARMLQATPVNWDGLTLELWSMLTTGGTCVLLEGTAPPEPKDVQRHIQQGLTLLWLTASLFNVLVDEAPECFEGLPHLLLGGERLSPPHVRRFLEQHTATRLTNGYGPAEATVFVATHDVTLADTRNPLGVPLGFSVAATGLHVVVDQEAPDAAGELVVTGPRVALGYLDRTLPSGFRPFPSDGEGGRRFATGDIVQRQGGLLHYLGRQDRRVKLLGRWVDPQHLEANLEQLPHVRQARAFALPGSGGATGLAAFVVAQPREASVLDHVRAHLLTLPAELRPRVLGQVDGWPLTANGKLDQRALLEGATRAAAAPILLGRTVRIVLQEAREVLEVPALQADDELLRWGASSLDVMRLLIRLERRLGRPLPTGLTHAPLTAQSLASRVDAWESPQPTDTERSNVVPLDPVQTAFLLQRVTEPDNSAGICPMLWSLDGHLKVRALEAALQDLAERHPALHDRYALGPPTVRVAVDPAPPLQLLLLPWEPQQPVDSVVAALCDPPLRPEAGAVLRAVLMQGADPSECLLGLAVHHVAFDGWSEAILAADLSVAYASRLEGRAPIWSHCLPAAGAVAERRLATMTYSQEDVAFWRRYLDGVQPVAWRAPDSPLQKLSPLTSSIALEPRAFAPWTSLARSRNCTLFQVLLAVWGQVLLSYAHVPDVVVGVPAVVSRSAEDADVITCSINTVCYRLGLEAQDLGWSCVLERLIRDGNEMEGHRSIFFPDLVRELAPRRGRRSPVYQTIFALQDNDPAQLHLPGVTGAFVRCAPPDSPAELVVEVWTSRPGGPLLTITSGGGLESRVAPLALREYAELLERGPGAAETQT